MTARKPTDKVQIRIGILQILFDALATSMDFGSGFLEQDDINALRYTANILGVCPQMCTPKDMRHKYKECDGIRAWRQEQADMFGPHWNAYGYGRDLGHNDHDVVTNKEDK